ncbi:MAG TPA: hypothetical protein P5295_16110 [Spirochaetota bacterium]|nr:hypothetical protein [Spirochaetota bacterium]
MGQNVSGGLVTERFVKTYTTFSGVDITALFDDMTLMTLQGIAVSITREKVPVYVFGRSRPVSISRTASYKPGAYAPYFMLTSSNRLYSPITAFMRDAGYTRWYTLKIHQPYTIMYCGASGLSSARPAVKTGISGE